MQKIVVGFDGTATARHAASDAAALARSTGAELHVVNVVDDDRLRQGMISTTAFQEIHDAAAATVEHLRAELDGVATQTQVISGAPAAAMVRYATEIDADLIVVGNRRVQGIERILGSVAVDILRHAPCNVLVAHTV